MIPAPNGNGKHAVAPAEQKSIPQITPAYFWMDGNPDQRTWNPGDVSRWSAYTLASLAYICIRYRAAKMAEAPLMVVEQQQDGSEDWLPNHALDALLDEPNADFGMPDMLEATSVFLDTTGRCLWLKNRSRSGKLLSMYPYSGDEFESRSKDGMLWGEFDIQTQNGTVTRGPKDVVLFQEFRPGEPHRGLARLDLALSHLNMSAELVRRIRATLKNAASPGGIYTLPVEARLDQARWDRLNTELNNGFRQLEAGKTLLAEGGGKFERVAWTLKDMALGDLWRENEGEVAAVFGLPAALLNLVVGMENAPWSHLSIIKKNVDDDTFAPLRVKFEMILRRQLLREVDTNRLHLVRFDTSRIRALQTDQITKSQIVGNISRISSLNERRRIMGMSPVDDPKADKIPELEFPNATAAPSAAATPPADAAPRADGGDS